VSKNLPYKINRLVYPYVFLWSACNEAMELARTYSDSKLPFMTSMLLSSFCLEAYLNHLAMMKHGGDWRSFERSSSPDEKLKVLAEKIGYHLDLGVRPFQTFSTIFKFRNAIAHAKTEHVQAKSKMALTDFIASDKIPPEPLTEWEKHLTPKMARRFLDDSLEMIKELHKTAGLGVDPFDQPFSNTRLE